MAIPRLWARQLFKLLVGVTFMLGLVGFTDLYFNYLPSNIYQHIPLVVHPDEVVVDMEVKTCLSLTGCFGGNKPGWSTISKNLYLKSSWTRNGFVHVKKLKHDQLEKTSKIVVNAAFGEKNKVPSRVLDDLGVSQTPSKDKLEAAGWFQKDNYFWIKYHASQKLSTFEPVTAVDVLFGWDAADPRKGWSLIPGFILPTVTSEPRLSLRIGAPKPVEKPVLKMNSSNKFKILQAADFHFSTGEGHCLDTFPEFDGPCAADTRTLEHFIAVLDQEKPDLVIFTGDQVFGSTAPDAATALLKVFKVVIDRKIPFATTFGNHDHEGNLKISEMMEIVQSLPYSLSEAGPDDVDGVGNYLITVEGAKSNHPALSLYFVDSHDNQKSKAYDYIHENQLEYMKKLHRGIKESQNAYSHIPLSMAFFHIPLPEYNEPDHPKIGEHREQVSMSNHNSGARDVFSDLGVSVITVGHDHVNDYCMYHSEENRQPIWLCYGGGAGEGAYGGYGGWIRRFRLFEIDGESGTIKSWKLKRNELNNPVDVQILVENGKAISPV